MTRRPLLRAFAILAFVGLTACAGGDYADLAQLEPEEKEGGIVGTGIIGAVTGLGSIHVNGLRVTLPEKLMIASPMGMERPEDLRPGDTVVIEIMDDRSGLEADRVTRYLPLIAPIGDVDPGAATFTALDALVLVPRGAPVVSGADGAEIGLAGLGRGDWVAVSGVWRGSELIATRIKRVARQEDASVSGQVTLHPGGVWRIGGARLIGADPELRKSEGKAATVRGRAVGGAQPGLAPSGMRLGLFSGEVRRLSAEGYVTGPMPDGRHMVYGAGVPVAIGPASMPPGRVILCAIRNGEMRLRGLLTLPEAEDMRVAKLETMAAEPMPGPDSCGM